MFFTSMVAAEEKMNSWMIGGRMRAPRARGSRSMVISSLRTMASSRCSTADAPSVQPLVQPPPGEAEEQRSDGQHEQHVGHEHRPQVAGEEYRLQRDVQVARRERERDDLQPRAQRADVEQKP